MSVLQNINGSLYRMDASDLVQLAAVDTEGILGGTPGATTDGQTLVDQLAADDVQAKTDLSDQQDEIEAILNVYGAKNLAKTKGQTSTVRGVTYTANADGTYTPSNTAASGGNSWYDIWNAGYTIPAGSYYIGDASGAGFVDGHRNSIRLSDNTYVTPNTVVTLTDSLQIVEWSLGVADGTTAEQRDFKPVIIDSRILDRSFTTPVMTNRELTEKSQSLTNTTQKLQNCKYHTHESGTKTITCTNTYQQFIMTIFKGSARAVYLLTKQTTTATHKELVYLTNGQTEPTITVTNTGDRTFTISLPTSTQTNIYCTEPFTVS